MSQAQLAFYQPTPDFNTLYHHGILGMRWGVRRYQNRNGTLTRAGKNRYKVSKTDVKYYGKRGAERIAKRKAKGDSAQSARTKELVWKFTKIIGGTILGSMAYYGLQTGQFGRVLKAGKKAYDAYQNISVLDKSGKVIKKYHSQIRTGQAIASRLLKG